MVAVSWQALVAGWMSALFIAGMPTSTNYSLQSYGVGSGGVADSTSTNYQVNGLTGQLTGRSSSAHYTGGFGLNYHMQGNVPTLTLTNDDNWYDKLHLTLNPAGNPSDTKFLIAISTDGFATTLYIKNDLTITPTLNSSDYMTYADLGGAAGVILRGLTESTVYSVQADALRNSAFTETGLGPVTSASTVDEQLAFRLDIAPTYSSTSPPYIVNLGSLVPGSIVTASDKIWTTLSSNADNGAYVYGDGQYGGLSSATTSHTIASSSVNLVSVAEGFGEQDASVSQTSGGPMAKNAIYNVSGVTVGKDTTDLAELFTSSGAPIVSGVGGIAILGKSSKLTLPATDYTETLTLVASGSF
jgi:hypothetical protein